MITIFTPTYNRANYLKVCYASLLNQSYTDFEWLIIDDGSDDNTKAEVERFQSDAIINIRYIYQNNAGKQAAWNMGVLNAKGEYFIGVDSDDALVADSIKVFFEDYIPLLEELPHVIGIRALSMSDSTKNADNAYLIDAGSVVKSWFDEFASRVSGERIDIFKTALIKDFLYPIEDGVKFIPEIWFYANVSEKYDFLYVNKFLRYFYDGHNENRLSRSSLERNAKGHFIARMAMLNKIPMKYFFRNPVALIKTVIRLLQVSYFMRKSKR